MSGPATYRQDDSIAVITLDDGKANVLGPGMQWAINEALDSADRDDVGARHDDGAVGDDLARAVHRQDAANHRQIGRLLRSHGVSSISWHGGC